MAPSRSPEVEPRNFFCCLPFLVVGLGGFVREAYPMSDDCKEGAAAPQVITLIPRLFSVVVWLVLSDKITTGKRCLAVSRRTKPPSHAGDAPIRLQVFSRDIMFWIFCRFRGSCCGSNEAPGRQYLTDHGRLSDSINRSPLPWRIRRTVCFVYDCFGVQKWTPCLE